MKTLKSIVQVLILSWICWPCITNAAIITFSSSSSFDFKDKYYGDPGQYTTVQGSVSGWGAYSLNQAVPVGTILDINLDLIIGPDSIGGGDSTGWSLIDLSSKTVGVAYAFDSKTVSASSFVWLTEEQPTKHVRISANMNYAVSGPGIYEFGQRISRETVEATTNVPEPETYAMMLAGLGLFGLAARGRRQRQTQGLDA